MLANVRMVTSLGIMAVLVKVYFLHLFINYTYYAKDIITIMIIINKYEINCCAKRCRYMDRKNKFSNYQYNFNMRNVTYIGYI